MQNYSEMSEVMSGSLRKYLISFAVLLLLFMIVPELLILLVDPANAEIRLATKQNIIKVASITIIPIVQTVIAFLASLFVHLEVHSVLDRVSFRMRSRTTQMIVLSLTSSCRSQNCSFVDRISNNEIVAMRHFYHLTNEMKPDLTQVFDRWARYYLSLYLILFCGAIALTCTFLRFEFLALNRLLVVSCAFLLIGIILALSIVIQLRPRLEELARSSPSQLLSWDENEVLKHMLAVCEVNASLCPWTQAKSSGRPQGFITQRS